MPKMNFYFLTPLSVTFFSSFQVSGLGAGMDSFYEYLLKSYILFEEKTDLHMFTELYDSVKQVHTDLIKFKNL